MPRHAPSRLLLLSLVTGCAAAPSGPADWMADVFRDAPELTLGSILIPGTHDSASYGCAVDNGISPHAGALLESLWSLPGDDDGGGAARETVVGWAHTQGLTIAGQLEAGVRSLDLRVTSRDGELVTWHSVYSLPLADVLDEVVAFAVAHPREVVLLGFGLDLSPDDRPAFADALTAPRADGASVCDRLVDLPGPAAALAIGDVQDGGRNLVWSPDPDLRAWLDEHVDCPASDVESVGWWSRTTTPEGVAQVLADTVASRDEDRLLVNDFIFSLEGTDDVLEQARFVTTYATLHDAEAALGFSGDLPGRLIATYDVDHRMNVLGGDFVDETDLVEAAIAADRARASR